MREERILSAALAGDRYLAGRISPTDTAAAAASPCAGLRTVPRSPARSQRFLLQSAMLVLLLNL
jgi:hypothetical protein